MKTLILLRHGKAEEWAATDFERPLKERGKHQATLRGQEFVQLNIKPDLILSSDAQRTRDTTASVLQGLGFPEQKVQWNANLYNASSAAILAQIMRVSDEVQTLIVIGHNNGLSELVSFFHGQYLNLETAGYALFEFQTNEWSGIVDAEIAHKKIDAEHPA